MHKRTFVGLCAALAFVAGSPGAHALKIADAAPTDRAGVTAAAESFTYASETLLTTAVTDVKDDSTKYYNVGDTATPCSLPARRCCSECGGYLHCQRRLGRHGVPDCAHRGQLGDCWEHWH